MATRRHYLFTSESVSEGHPDKLCDQISDAVLDECLANDPESRVACECFASNELVLIGGEIHTKHNVDLPRLARDILSEVGYQQQAANTKVTNLIQEQSSDISAGVFRSGSFGAGDQGMMFGFACRDTADLMPLPITLAHRLMAKSAQLRRRKILPFLGPDAKCQVTVEYCGFQPLRVSTVVLSHQHHADCSLDDLRQQLTEQVVKPILAEYDIDSANAELLINPMGRFVLGGPAADTGLTGRKVIVDTYGGMGRHGGGAFSGKDPSKVDRSAAYMARYIAKNIVAAELAQRCEVQLSYAIGGVQPVAVSIDCFNTEQCDLQILTDKITTVFDLSPPGIVRQLQLQQPIFRTTSTYGHFGRAEFSWEQCDQVPRLQALVN